MERDIADRMQIVAPYVDGNVHQSMTKARVMKY
jgi:hypothetical protein